jgi:glutamine amidotransferase
MIHPIIDEFYSANPAHTRSAGFAQAKGQTITGPDKRVLPQRVNGDEDASGGSESHDGGSLRNEQVVNGAISRLRMG